MKRIVIHLVFLSLIPLSAFAEDPDAELREGPCNKILEACKTYAKSSKTKISLYRDCMQPLLNGETVADIKIEPAIIKACQVKKAEIKQKK